jgi:hypothetical protein
MEASSNKKKKGYMVVCFGMSHFDSLAWQWHIWIPYQAAFVLPENVVPFPQKNMFSFPYFCFVSVFL